MDHLPPLSDIQAFRTFLDANGYSEEALIARILKDHKGKIILIVTDSEYIQPVVAEMHGSKKLREFQPSEHDNIYIVSIPWFGKVKTLRLPFGAPYQDLPSVN